MQTLLDKLNVRMRASYTKALETIEGAMLEGSSECIFNRTNSPHVVSDDTIHSIVANMLIDSNFTVTSTLATYTVSGWNKAL
jgi:hypothetical protein